MERPPSTTNAATTPPNILHMVLTKVLNEPVPVMPVSSNSKEGRPAPIPGAEIVPNCFLVGCTCGPGKIEVPIGVTRGKNSDLGRISMSRHMLIFLHVHYGAHRRVVVILLLPCLVITAGYLYPYSVLFAIFVGTITGEPGQG